MRRLLSSSRNRRRVGALVAGLVFWGTCAAAAPPAPLSITIENAVLMSLEHNRSLRIEKLVPAITKTYEEQALAAFDPVVSGQVSAAQEKGPTGSAELPYTADTTSGAADVSVGLSQTFATGTQVGIDVTSGKIWSDRFDDRYHTRTGIGITQALLQGRGKQVNLAAVRQAGLDTRMSQYELRGFTESLLAEVEETYWDYALALRQIDIFEESLQLARQQLDEAQAMIEVGSLAETELIAAQAEIALRRQEVIEARSTMETARLHLLQLLNPTGTTDWDQPVTLLTQPVLPEVDREDVRTHVQAALRFRSDLNQARLAVERGELETVQTRNGLLPKLDLFITLGKTGYAHSFGRSVDQIADEGYDAMAGLTLHYPLNNRAARARHQRAELGVAQSRLAVDNLAQLVELDVRNAYIEMNRSHEQIRASEATRQLEEEKVRIETEKFRVGRSTNFLVAQAQRDLVRSRISQTQAVADYLKSLIRLYQLEGSLLERRGITLPEAEAIPAIPALPDGSLP